nr:MAG TPA: hypothetical protein [Caudoviricetes sp.]
MTSIHFSSKLYKNSRQSLGGEVFGSYPSLLNLPKLTVK